MKDVKNAILLSTVLLICIDVEAQSFQKRIFSNSSQSVSQIQQTLDIGYVLIGTKAVPYLNLTFALLSEGFIVKTDSSGNITWSKIFLHNQDSSAVSFNCIAECPDSSYIVAGMRTDSSGGVYTGWNPLIIKLDKQGNLLWSRTIAYDHSFADLILSKIYIINNSSLLIVGRKDFSTYIAKTDLDGNLLWQKEINRSNNASLLMEDGSLVLYNGFYLFKIDSNATPIWGQHFSYNGSITAKGLLRTTDNGFLLAQTNDYFDSFGTVALIRTDSIGNVEWSKGYRRSIDADMDFAGFYSTSDSGYVFGATGTPASLNLPLVPLFIKIDKLGSVEWIKSKSSSDSYVRSFTKSNDKGYLAGGQINTHDFYFLKTDSLFDLDCYSIDTLIGQSFPFSNLGTFNFQAVNDNYSFTNYSLNPTQSMSVQDLCTSNAIYEIKNPVELNFCPNPSSKDLIIKAFNFSINKIGIYNILGEKVSLSTPLQRRGVDALIDISNLQSGIYFVRVSNESSRWVGKFVKE